MQRNSIHEAGHVIANIALGIRFYDVHIGRTWYTDEKTGLVPMTSPPNSLGHCGSGKGKEPFHREIVKASGYIAEWLWCKHNNRRWGRTFRNIQYSRDRKGITNLQRAKRASLKLLEANYKYLTKLAELFDANQNHTFKESEILPLCDIWETNPVSMYMALVLNDKGTWDEVPNDPNMEFHRYTRKFKWYRPNYPKPEEVPDHGPLK